MIGKIKKGRSFGGCIRYVTQKDDAKSSPRKACCWERRRRWHTASGGNAC